MNSTDVVRAKRFELVDFTGATRGVFGLGGDGSPELSLNDEHEKPRVSIRLFADGSADLVLNGEDAKVHAALQVDKNGAGRLIVVDKDGKAHPAVVDSNVTCRKAS
jgi:hypothetical protein